jgi:hypothetical protein
MQFSSIDAYPRALLHRLDDGPVIVEKNRLPTEHKVLSGAS